MEEELSAPVARWVAPLRGAGVVKSAHVEVCIQPLESVRASGTSQANVAYVDPVSKTCDDPSHY